MTKITLGHPEAHEKLTAKILWKLRTATGYNDCGNVREFVDATTRNLVVRARAEDGARHVNDEQVDLNHEAYTFLLDEHDSEQEKLIKLANQLDDDQQEAAEGQSSVITSVTGGKWYAIGAYNINNVAVTASVSGACEEGTDYELDKESGRIKVIADAGISNGESLTLTFDQPNIDLEKFETQQSPLFYCDVIIELYNQFHKMWLYRYSGTGYLNVTEFPSQTGEFGTYRVKFTPSAALTVLKRPEAQTLPEHATTTEAAGLSSSSSSSSSATSSHSSSSHSTSSSSTSSSSS